MEEEEQQQQQEEERYFIRAHREAKDAPASTMGTMGAVEYG